MADRIVAPRERYARWAFTVAGVCGCLVLAPQYFLEREIGLDHPPAITHPEYFYGFVGIALAWQIAFVIIASDPIRFRPLMPAAIVEKLSFAVATSILFGLGRLGQMLFLAGLLDLMLGIAFAWAYLTTRPQHTQPTT
ncbi:MAG: hypothetical protein M3552_17615 [Planctomycetota bacterium]|nr:hypothetical protein [Planctomycetaceae bacterium]MDQ3332438.1 hypothetical protein [Planctomycetota bacterium]